MALLPPVVAQLLADTREFEAKMSKANAQMEKLGTTSATTGQKMGAFASKASTAIIGVGVALGAYGVDQALKFQKSLEAIRNQSGASATEVKNLGVAIMNISNATTISTGDLAAAALTIEQAGIRGKAAQTLLSDAAKAAVITNTSVIDSTKALVSAQSLQIAKGMDITKLTGILVAGSKHFTGGLAAEEKMLSGRVGVALANYGLKLKTIIPLGAEFAKVGLPSRSIASFTVGLANIEKPLTSTTGKFTTYAKNLAMLGINQANLATSLRRGDIPGLLQQINAAYEKGGGSLSTYVNAVFGSSGGAAASVLIKNIKDIAKVTKDVSGAGSSSLAASFGLSSGQLEFRIKKLKTEFTNAMTGLGLLLLPAVSDVANWVGNVVKEFQKHPLLGKIFDVTAAGLFGAAIVAKLTQGIMKIVGWFNAGTQIALLGDIAANTAAMAGGGAVGAATGGAALGRAGAGAGTLFWTGAKAAGGILGAAAAATFATQWAGNHDKNVAWWDPVKLLTTAVNGLAVQIDKINPLVSRPGPTGFSTNIPGTRTSRSGPPKKTTTVRVVVHGPGGAHGG